MARSTTLSVTGLARALERKPEDVIAAKETAREREMKSNLWDELDDPVEKLLWLLLLHDPEVEVNAAEGSVSGIDPEFSTIIDQFKEEARETDANMELIPTLNFT